MGVDNHLTQYREVKGVCEACNGIGAKPYTKDEFEELMFELFDEKWQMCDDALAMKFDWVKDGELPCNECDGTGVIYTIY